MTKRERFRRVVLLCAHFTRNLAYCRAAQGRVTSTSSEFWRTFSNNCLDIAVLEWCKLFSDRNGKHSWSKVLADPARFESDLFATLSITATGYDSYVEEMRTYRNKFLAHLDDLTVMDIPLLDRAQTAAELYHRQLFQDAAGGDLAALPPDLAAYYRECFNEATAIYDRCGI